MNVEEYRKLIVEESKPNRSKYNSKRVLVDGIHFHSQKEANRYLDLKLLVKALEISELKLQEPFPFFIKGKKIFTYYADFTYYDHKLGRRVIEDVKSVITQKDHIYRLKKKIIEAEYNVEIYEYI